MSPTLPNRNWTLPPPPLGDPLLADRLARLDSRRPGAATRPTPLTSPRPPAVAASRTPGKRRHPAKASRAAALVMSIGSTAGLTAYFYQADSSAALGTGAASIAAGVKPSVVMAVVPATVVPATVVPAAVVPATVVPASTAPAPAAPAVPAVAANALADGTFIGQTFINRWGPVQVQVAISSGQITDVTALQTPGGRSLSIQISNIAAPIMRTEALASESAQIHTVSGATYTSKGYRQSLQSALDAAKAQATANAG